VVGLSGFEPLTSRLSAVRSSQLSYRPVAFTVGPFTCSRGRDLSNEKERHGHPKVGRVAP
jgi:hypothetical protein